jgi:bifunctional pyridoxal-dependent enzyme with beta-cystathionase and maltose regulon repressor activities
MNCRYVDLTKTRNKQDNTTVEHHYRVDMFAAAIDRQLQELNARFSEQSTKLLTLCAPLDPRDDSFSISKICMLAEKFYPADFSDQEKSSIGVSTTTFST